MAQNEDIDKEMQKMQAEAIKRVREMHMRSKSEAGKFSIKNKTKNDSKDKTNQPKITSDSYQKENKNKSAKMPNLMSLLFSDNDRSLLIVLIVLLMDDEKNFYIIMVLLYLLI